MKKIVLVLAVIAGVAQAMPASNRITLPSGRKIFVSGMNLAWINFGTDVGDAPLDTNSFKQAIQDVRDSGGNTMRVWLSTNGANDPKFNGVTGLVSGLGSKTVSNVKSMLSIANRNGMVLVLDLLSHNLMAGGQVGSWNQMSIANNAKLLKTDSGIAAYVKNAVLPLVTAIGSDTGILCWEVFNEPEGMITGNATNWGLVDSGITITNIQTVINRVAGAIHRAVPGILVSNGSVTFDYTTNADGKKNYYTDSALKAVGGDANGTLDFYMVHYYGWNGTSNSPFTKPFSHWNLDKPLVVAEFPAGDWSPAISSKNQDAAKEDTLLTYLHNSGYAGGLPWCYFGDGTDKWLGNITTAGAGLKAMFKQDSAAIKIKDVVRVKQSGNGVLAVNVDNDLSSIVPALKLTAAQDFSSKTSISFDLLVPKSATGGIKVTTAFQTNNFITWNASGVYCTPMNDSTWTTCKANFSSYVAPSEMNSIGATFFQFIANPTFHGQVWLDNIRVDSDTLWNFNDGRVVFGADTYDTAQAARITGLNVIFPTPNITAIAPRTASAAAPNWSLVRSGSNLAWTRSRAVEAGGVVRLVGIDGRVLSRATVVAGERSGTLAAPNSGVAFLVLESAGVREVRALPIAR
jgi:hypothetical protein